MLDKDHKWTVRQIAQHNEATGGKFFALDTLRGWGDTLASFTVVQAEGKIYIKRILNAKKKPASVPSEIGKLSLFNPETGDINTISNLYPTSYDKAEKAKIPASLMVGTVKRYYAE